MIGVIIVISLFVLAFGLVGFTDGWDGLSEVLGPGLLIIILIPLVGAGFWFFVDWALGEGVEILIVGIIGIAWVSVGTVIMALFFGNAILRALGFEVRRRTDP